MNLSQGLPALEPGQLSTSPFSHPDCWAGALQDCGPKTSEEHLISVAVWGSVGKKDNRAGRRNRKIKVQAPLDRPLPSGLYRVDDVTDKILCSHHNSTSSPLDQCAGQFRDAIDRWQSTREGRQRSMRSNRWLQRKLFKKHPVEYDVDGRLLERWFIKIAINNAVRLGLPIGDPAAPVNRPTLELCEVVFGRKHPPGHIGLYGVAAEDDLFTMGEKFSLLYWQDINATHIAGALMRFRGNRFAINLVDRPIQPGFANSVPEWAGMTFIRPFHQLLSGDGVETSIRFRWMP